MNKAVARYNKCLVWKNKRVIYTKRIFIFSRLIKWQWAKGWGRVETVRRAMYSLWKNLLPIHIYLGVHFNNRLERIPYSRLFPPSFVYLFIYFFLIRLLRSSFSGQTGARRNSLSMEFSELRSKARSKCGKKRVESRKGTSDRVKIEVISCECDRIKTRVMCLTLSPSFFFSFYLPCLRRHSQAKNSKFS